MVDKILNFVQSIKEKGERFYLYDENLDDVINDDYDDRPRIIKRLEDKYNVSVDTEKLTLDSVSDLKIDWQLTLDNIYIYGGVKINALSTGLTSPISSLYESIACEHDYFTEEQERFLKEETNWFTKSAHGMGDGTYGILHRTKEKFPFDILYLDDGIYFKTNFTTASYYQSLIDSMGICGWQYFYLDFEEIQKKCADFKVGINWLLYPYGEGMSESPIGRNVTQETTRLDALVHHMEKCVYLLPKIFPEQDFSYHKQRLTEFKAFLGK